MVRVRLGLRLAFGEQAYDEEDGGEAKQRGQPVREGRVLLIRVRARE